MTLSALIFDVDGTLAETERQGHRMAFNRAFQELGYDWYWDERFYAELLAIGGGRERLAAFLKHYQKDVSLRNTAKAEALLNDLHQVKTKHFKDIVAEGSIVLRPGVKRLLTEAKEQGIRLAVATNCSPTTLDSICRQQLGVSAVECFEVRVTGDRVTHKKPDPASYQTALAELNLPASACMAFEDSNIGLTSAWRNQIPTVVTVADYTEGEDFTNACVVLSSLGEPDLPCHVLSGSLYGHSFVDVAALQDLHRHCALPIQA